MLSESIRPEYFTGKSEILAVNRAIKAGNLNFLSTCFWTRQSFLFAPIPSFPQVGEGA